MKTHIVSRHRSLLWTIGAIGLTCVPARLIVAQESKTPTKAITRAPRQMSFNGFAITEPPDKFVRDMYTTSDGSTVKIVGIASITESKIDAWDYSGKRSQSVIDKFTNLITESSKKFTNSPYSRFEFRFGKKNRYALLQFNMKGDVRIPIVPSNGSPIH